MLSHSETLALLEEKYNQYNCIDFIETDPISIPHQFNKKEDIEIASFLAATIAWGQRKTIIANANKLMQWMDYAPHQFILNFSNDELKPFKKFTHRTFNGIDCVFFLKSLKNIYKKHGGLEKAFSLSEKHEMLQSSVVNFRKTFFEIFHPARTQKHVSNPEKTHPLKE